MYFVSVTHGRKNVANLDPETLEYTTQPTKIHRKGMGIIMSNHKADCVAGHISMSDRTMLIKITEKPLHINIFQVNAPTFNGGSDEIEEFYPEIETHLKTMKPHELIIIQGDFNAKVGNTENYKQNISPTS